MEGPNLVLHVVGLLLAGLYGFDQPRGEGRCHDAEQGDTGAVVRFPITDSFCDAVPPTLQAGDTSATLIQSAANRERQPELGQPSTRGSEDHVVRSSRSARRLIPRSMSLDIRKSAGKITA